MTEKTQAQSTKDSESRADLLKRLDETLRKVGAQSVLMSDVVANLVGVNSTDLECLDLLELAGPTTAGGLARHSGLTTGATTVVIDRLERAGFVRRLRDSRDRRCVRVEPLPGSLRQIAPLYRPLTVAMARLHEEYDDRDLVIVADYLSRAVARCAEHVTWLQTQPPVKRPRRWPRGSTAAKGQRPTGSERSSRHTARVSARRS